MALSGSFPRRQSHGEPSLVDRSSRADMGRSTSETECSFLFARGYSTKGKAPPTEMSEASRDSVGGGANDSRAYLIADL